MTLQEFNEINWHRGTPLAPEASAEERAHQEALARKAANKQKNGQAKAEPKAEVKPVAPSKPQFRACSPELLETDKQRAKKVETPKNHRAYFKNC